VRSVGERGLALHYMTARETYNVIKAAEAGRSGNPEDYRGWRAPSLAQSGAELVGHRLIGWQGRAHPWK